MAFRKSYTSLDHMTLAAVYFRENNHKAAARELRAAAEDEELDDALEDLNEHQNEADPDGESDFEAYAAVDDESDDIADDVDVTIEDEGVSDGDLKAGDGSPVSAITARLQRASRNMRGLRSR